MEKPTNIEQIKGFPKNIITDTDFNKKQGENNIQSFDEYTSKQTKNQDNTEKIESKNELEKKRKILEVKDKIKTFNIQLLGCLEFYKDLTGEDFNTETIVTINETKKKCTDCLDHISEKQKLTVKYAARIDSLNDNMNKLEDEIDVLKSEVYIDELTQINNRKRFFQYYNAAIKGAETYERKKFTLAIIDVDNFKFFNDNYGHPAGDIVLKLLTAIINKQIGKDHKSTALCRIGGEEFAIISRRSPDEIHKILSNTLNLLTQKHLRIPNVPKDYRLSFSGGISSYQSSMNGNNTALLEDADAIMYQAKISGKGQILINNVPYSVKKYCNKIS